jgi:hypothetical protein
VKWSPSKLHGFHDAASGSAPHKADLLALVLPVRIELTTSPLPMGCSTTELRQHPTSRGSEYPIIEPMSSILAVLPVARTHPIRKTMKNSDKVRHRPVAAGKGDAARTERLRAALRQNLRRRKVQAKGRAQAEGGPSHDSAGFVPDKPRD